MRSISLVALFGLVACSAPAEVAEIPASRPILPIAASASSTQVEHPVGDLIHGTFVADRERWLEDVKQPQVQAWMKEHDDRARASLAKMPEREAIATRLRELYYVENTAPPVKRGAKYFQMRRGAKDEKSSLFLKNAPREKGKVMVDPNAWLAGGRNASIGTVSPSPRGKHVAYTVRENNSDESTLYVLDVKAGRDSTKDVIQGAKYADPSWMPDEKSFVYTYLPPLGDGPVADRPGKAEIHFHQLGTGREADIRIAEPTNDPTKFQSAAVSHDGKFIFREVDHGWSSVDLYFALTSDLNAWRAPSKDHHDRGAPLKRSFAWQPLIVGTDAHYSVEAFEGAFYVTTDEGASHGRIFKVDPKKPGRDAWLEVVPERVDSTIESAAICGGQLVLRLLRNATGVVEIRGLDGKLKTEVKLPGLGTVSALSGTPDERKAFFRYESFIQPPTIFELDTKTGTLTELERAQVPVQSDQYTTEQVFYPSKDGTRISMFVTHAKNAPKTGTPTLLNGYGGFQVSRTPTFRASIYPWLERGGAYAVPNLRGGGEYGEAWHRDGMLLKKQNVFDDFIAAAEFLIAQKVASPKSLVIQGGSNGGLLVGAAMTQRPDLYAGVVCAVPLLDMVRYHLFGSGKTWISEYGSSDNEEQFRVLFGYSPYHRVTSGKNYPPLLLLSADNDDRVDPMHARKFAAALERAGHEDVLLRIEKQAGHGGADMVRQAIEMDADQYAFMLQVTGDARKK